MGLDNGIVIRKTNRTKELHLDEMFPISYEGSVYLDVCYFRRCWNIRSPFISYLMNKYKENNGEWQLDVADIRKFITILASFTKDNYLDKGECFFDKWKGFKRVIRRDIIGLTYLQAKMEDFPNDFEVTFYDSY